MNYQQSVMTNIKLPPYSVSEGWILNRILDLVLKPLGQSNCQQKIKPGTLSSTVKSNNFTLGIFTVYWENSTQQSSSLRITKNNKTIWSTPAGQNFIGGADITLAIVEDRGSIEIDENYLAQFSHQTITEIQDLGDTLIINGLLRQKPSDTKGVEYRFSLKPLGNYKIDFNLELLGEKANQAQFSYVTSAEEHFYGFGEQFSDIDGKGQLIPIVCEEGGIGRGDPGPKTLTILGVAGNRFSSYASVPHFLTNKGHSLFLTNTEPSVFDLRNSALVHIRVESSQMQGQLLFAETPLDLIELYTEYSGRMPALPDWVHSGAIVGMQGGTDEVREVWSQLKKLDTPIAGFWLQDWVGKRKTIAGQQLWWNWQLDHEAYPGWDLLVKEFQDEGIAVGVYINPFLVEFKPEQIATKPDLWRNLFQEGLEGGFLVKKENGQPYLVKNTDFSAALIDVSNPQTREWFKDIIKTAVLGVGAKFWMADFAEAAQFDGVFASGESGLSYHNQYPVDWAELNRTAIAEANREGDAWFFTRAGYSRTPGATTAMWLGDQNVTWQPNDGLPSALCGLLSGGFSGLGINHSDIGGYTSISNILLRLIGRGFVRSRELLYRWLEMNAFSPIFRTHEGNEPDKNYQFYTDDDTFKTFSYWAKIYAAFADYRQKLIQEMTTKGYPVIRHLILHYPDDSHVYSIEHQFLYGSEFLVAPVLKKGQTMLDVYLPQGQWVHLWSQAEYDCATAGKWFKIAAPINEPAVFYRQDSADGRAIWEKLKQQDLLELKNFFGT